MKRPYYFAKLDIPHDMKEAEREIVLWRSVIDQALQDFMFPENSSDGKKWQKAAQVWLRGNSPDFWEVCFLSVLDPFKVVRGIGALIGGRNKLFEDL